MLQPNPAAAVVGHPPKVSTIESYSVELTPLADGRVYVGVNATICEAIPGDEFELVSMEMASTRVGTLEEALAVIRNAVTGH
jgi:hypothetical protein